MAHKFVEFVGEEHRTSLVRNTCKNKDQINNIASLLIEIVLTIEVSYDKEMPHS